jgi:gluconokinase
LPIYDNAKRLLSKDGTFAGTKFSGVVISIKLYSASNQLKEKLILALDIGTSSVRAALYDFDGNVLPETMVKNERTLVATDDGGAEIDAAEAFAQIERAIDDVLEKSKKIAGEIAYAAASSFWHSLVGVDRRGRPTTKIFGWADTRSREFVPALRARLDEDEIHNRTGARFHSSFWTAKLLWLKTDFPQVFAKTDRWLSFSDYAALELFGEAQTSVSMASATGIFDIRRSDWDEDLIDFLGLGRENFAAVAETDAATFALAARYRKRWPRLAGTQWFLAIGDGAANNVGAGCATKSKAALMIGTSGAMRVAYAGDPPPRIPRGLWCYRIDRRRVIIGGALSDGGGLYRWLKDNLRLKEDDDHTERELAARAPDAHGLVFLPFLAGERSTGYHESAFGGVLGLKSATDTIDIVQAALESVAYRFAEIFDQLNGVCPIREIIASGGALRESPVWTQIIADTLGRTMFLPDTREASSRGAVLVALEAARVVEHISRLKTPKGNKFKFDRRRHVLYRLGREKHEKYYELLLS